MHITMTRRLSYTLALALALAVTVVPDTRTHAQAGGRERTLFVSAVDEKGEPIEGLGPETSVVREDGVRREVLRVSRATEPIDIALLVDNSAAADDVDHASCATRSRRSSRRWPAATRSRSSRSPTGRPSSSTTRPITKRLGERRRPPVRDVAAAA